jgi:hypothetical protein
MPTFENNTTMAASFSQCVPNIFIAASIWFRKTNNFIVQYKDMLQIKCVETPICRSKFKSKSNRTFGSTA